MAQATGNSEPPVTVVVKRDNANALGIAAFVFGLISIFTLAPIFVPLAIIVGTIAIIKKQLAWGIIGLVCALIGFLTSPILMGLVGIMTIGAILSPEPKKSTPPRDPESPLFDQHQRATAKHATSRLSNEATRPQKVLPKSAKDARVKNLPDRISRDFKAGPVMASAYGTCSPLLNECEHYVVLRYGDQSLKIDSVGSYFRPMSEGDISWVNKRFVAMSYATGGNCRACEGIHVAKLEGGMLFDLGEFARFKDGYLVRPYLELELNDLTSHARAPHWDLYYKDLGNKVLLDVSKTCSVPKDNYDKERGALLLTLSAKGRSSDAVEDDGWSLEEDVKSELLKTLALARYCGWNSDYVEVLNAAKSSHGLVSHETLRTLGKELARVELAEQAQ